MILFVDNTFPTISNAPFLLMKPQEGLFFVEAQLGGFPETVSCKIGFFFMYDVIPNGCGLRDFKAEKIFVIVQCFNSDD